MFTIVLLTEDALTPHDVERVAGLHAPEPVRVRVLVPVDVAHNRLVETLDDLALGQRPHEQHDGDAAGALTAAEAALATSLDGLRGAGLEADGAVVDGEPVDDASAAATELDADEIIVVTAPHLVETTLRRDWGSRLRAGSGRPVLHVVAGTDRVV